MKFSIGYMKMNENHTGLMIDTLKKIASFKERNQEGVFHRTMEAWIAFETLKKIGVYKDGDA